MYQLGRVSLTAPAHKQRHQALVRQAQMIEHRIRRSKYVSPASGLIVLQKESIVSLEQLASLNYGLGIQNSYLWLAGNEGMKRTWKLLQWVT